MIHLSHPQVGAGRARRSIGGVGSALAIAALVVVVTGCPAEVGAGTSPTTIGPGINHAPVITSFSAIQSAGPSPVTTALRWSISDADAQPLTCTIVRPGAPDITVTNCTSSSTRSATFTAVGSDPVALMVTDGQASVSRSSSIQVSPPLADHFDITLRLNGSMTATQQAAFTNAATRWEQVIRTGLSDTSLNIGPNDCGTDAPAFNGPVDDVLIDATIAPIDGVGSILGQAGPCRTRSVGGLPSYGVMKFDVADVTALETDGDLNAVILHEMGHVLGFGTVWSGHGLSGAGTSNPVFDGPTAVGAWQAVGGVGPVPVENSGGAGTADSHWRESVFNGELMTGYIDHGNNPLSAITIGAFADLGYGVDLGAADAFGLGNLRREASSPDVELRTVLIFPPNPG